jgi:hypothetical protein
MHANHSMEDSFGLRSGRAGGQAAMLLRNLDLVLLALAAAPALLLGAPALGFAIGAGGWVLQRIVQRADRGWIMRAREPRNLLGLNIAESFGRIWLLAGAIIIAAVVGGRHDGLTAAVTIFAAYSVAFVIRVLSGPPAGRP